MSKIVVTKEFLEEELKDCERQYKDYKLMDDIDMIQYTRGKMDAIKWILGISTPIEKYETEK